MSVAYELDQQAIQTCTRATLHDRVLGCLFGSSLGDAIGLYTEFLTPELAAEAYPDSKITLLPHDQATPLRSDPHRDPHDPGEWTDDTDHAMLILLAYLDVNGQSLDPNELAQRLRIWVDQGLLALNTLPLGLGRTVGAIVKNECFLDDPEGTARGYWTRTGYNIAPNGSLMRTHPLGLMCLEKNPEETFEIAASFSNVTHVDPRCVISCAVGTALVRGLVLGEIRREEDIDALMDRALLWWTSYRERQMTEHPDRKDEPDLDIEEFKKHAKVKDLSELELSSRRGIGYVYKCFRSGIHLLRLAMRADQSMSTQMNLFETLITDLIMRAGDADTNACFAGALVGTFLGYKALPSHWRDGLKRGDWLLSKSEELCAVLGLVDGVENKRCDTARDGGRGMLSADQLEERALALQTRMVERDQARRKEHEKAKGQGWFKWK